jgi:hypothetical protein
MTYGDSRSSLHRAHGYTRNQPAQHLKRQTI